MPLQATSGAASYDAFGGGAAAVPQYIEDVFSTYLYTGNGSTQTITNGIDLSGKGGLVWLKPRSGAGSHGLYDTVRGIENVLNSNTTAAQSSSAAGVSAFNSTGFSLGNQFNSSSVTYASWTFRKQPKFFDIQTWTGNDVNGRTISHNLGSTPGCIIVKKTNAASDIGWAVYHRGAASNLVLNLSDAQGTNFGSDVRTPTSTTFAVSAYTDVNSSDNTYIAYLFAHDAGGFGLTGTDNVISCGSFDATSAGSVTLGYEPQWVLIKASNDVGSWHIQDNMRGYTTSGNNPTLDPDRSVAEFSGGYTNPTATGFTYGGMGSSFIYIAIRRGPMKVPTSGTSVFTPESRTGTGSSTYFATGPAPTDLFYTKRTNGAGSSAPGFFWSRLQGKNGMSPTSTAAESATYAVLGFDSPNNTGTRVGNTNNYWDTTDQPYVNYSFKRAPSAFDVVCWSGTGTNVITHNLTVPPELIIEKTRTLGNAFANWWTWRPNTGGDWGILNGTSVFNTGSGNLTATSTTFEPLVDTAGQNYVAYLFATCAGVSKVGSYTGTGTLTTINCGFTGGARFVLIKRTDSTSNWFVWDTSRGMVSGSDFALYLNTNAAESNADSVYTTSTGFQLLASPVEDVNSSGGTYIFLAIA
jgi:hypothetical protein